MSTLRCKDIPTWFLRIAKDNNEQKPVMRIDMEGGGHEYLLLSMSESGELINDIYFASSGSTYTTQLAEAARMLIAPNKSIIKRLFGALRGDDDLVEIFKQLGELRKEQKFVEAYNLLKTLSPELQRSRTILSSTLVFSQSVSDEAYFEELKTLAKYHGDGPDLQFMLVDYYTLIEDYNKALAALDSVEDRFGPDSAL
ncbi:MAG: hypothetical protein ACJAVV_002846 [Alphaproteobacteria bacterium]